MSTVIDINTKAELALAAYANLSVGTPAAAALVDQGRGMSLPQATQFATDWRVITQFNDSTTSFSATVFADASGNLTLAIRGTLEPGDFGPTDGMIASRGVGYDQVVAMWNWWQRVSAAAGTVVLQYRITEIPMDPSNVTLLGGGLYLEPISTAVATGDLLPALAADPDHKLDVTGHSLGGHLAMAFGSLFPDVINQITAFDAPGFISNSANQSFFTRLGGAMPTGANTTNVIADQANVGTVGWSAIAGLNSRPGTAVNIPIESQWLSDEPNPPEAKNHSEQTLTDALAVYALLSKLDPTLTTTAFKSILADADGMGVALSE